MVNLVTGQTAPHAGLCTRQGDSDGKLLIEARFNKPYGVTLSEHDLYIADFGNNAIKTIREGHDHVYTIIQGDLVKSPRVLAIDPYTPNDIAYVTSDELGLLSLNLDNREITRLTNGNGTAGSLSAAMFIQPHGIAFLRETILLIALYSTDQLGIADIKRNRIKYICDGNTASKDGDIHSCQFKNPVSVMATSWSVYIGETDAIRRLPLKAIQEFIRDEPTLPEAGMSD